MFTQCPHCLTLFRVRAEHLKIALGMVRCNQCRQVFNAVDYLQEDSAPFPGADKEPPGNVKDAPVDQEEETSPPQSLAAPGGETPEVVPGEDGPADESVEVALDEDKAQTTENGPLAEALIDDDSVLPDEPADHDLSDGLALEFSGSLPDIEPSEDVDEDVDLIGTTERSRTGSWILSGFVMILIVALGIQSLWWYRDKLIYHDQARLVLETVCRATGCALPHRRALDKLRILHRDFSSHPSIKDALLLRLTLINQAAFPQPYPILQLGLLDDNERLVAQRRFLPSNYLASAPSLPALMDTGIAIELSLELVDPGVEATGFRFDFF